MSDGEGDRLAELARRRGFFFPANAAYGGTAGFYVYGPAGAALKRNLEDAWRERFALAEGHLEIVSPTVMPEPVFEASGHLDGFDDMLVECAACGASHRADHLVEDAAGIDDAERLPPGEVAALLAEYDIACPACGAALAGADVEPFNLMFETAIGPGSQTPGYLRPETAQGMFVEFPRLAEYARGKLPFGVTQIGTAYRNEISPRRGLVRLREFTQAELELFVDPGGEGPPLDRVADVELPLYSAAAQEAGDDPAWTTVADATAAGTIADEWIGYYLGVATRWFASIGIDLDRLRHRQHLDGELAHYASDCWDAEVEIDGDWIEITGFAHRGSYDLRRHAAHADGEFSVFRQYDEPRTVDRVVVDPDMSRLGPRFGADATAVAETLAELADRDPDAFDADEVTVEVDGEPFAVPADEAGFAVEEETVAGEHVVPHVIEPSFGVDRIVYAVLAHALEEDEVDGEPRTVLAIDPAVAPTFVGVFPLMDRDGLGDRARELAATLREAGFAVTYDDSGSIGRRYRRQDEVGTPYCVTVDYETLDDDTVTVRERDSAAQRRVEAGSLASVLAALRAGDREFDSVGAAVADA